MVYLVIRLEKRASRKHSRIYSVHILFPSQNSVEKRRVAIQGGASEIKISLDRRYLRMALESVCIAACTDRRVCDRKWNGGFAAVIAFNHMSAKACHPLCGRADATHVAIAVSSFRDVVAMTRQGETNMVFSVCRPLYIESVCVSNRSYILKIARRAKNSSINGKISLLRLIFLCVLHPWHPKGTCQTHRIVSLLLCTGHLQPPIALRFARVWMCHCRA